jgi:hypothetical protein
MSAKIPYRSPETPATPAPRLRWTLRAESEAGEIVAGVLGAGGGLFSVFVAMLFVSNGPTPSVLRGLLVDALVWALFCALFLRRAPEVTL